MNKRWLLYDVLAVGIIVLLIWYLTVVGGMATRYVFSMLGVDVPIWISMIVGMLLGEIMIPLATFFYFFW